MTTTKVRFARVTLAAAIAFVAIGLACFWPHAASADVFDPSDNVKTLVQNFYPTAQAWAFRLYTLLLGFELLALAVTAILFRDNIGEFIGGVALKVLIGSVFLYFVSNGQTFFQDVINGFAHAGMKAGGSDAGTPLELVTSGFAASALFFGAAEAAHSTDATLLNSPAGNVCTGALTAIQCMIGVTGAMAKAHVAFEMITQALALIVILAFSSILLQIILVTIESYIVMFAGVFFIGFAGSRFTMPYSQGYFKYMISVGVKLFTMYLVAGVVSTMLPNIISAAAASLVAACCIPDGYGASVGLFAAAIGGFDALVAAAIIYAIPNYAAAFLSGQSSASASGVMSQVTSMVMGPSMLRQLDPKKPDPDSPSDKGKGGPRPPADHKTAPAHAASKDAFAHGTAAPGASVPFSASGSTGGALSGIGTNASPGLVVLQPDSVLAGPRALSGAPYGPSDGVRSQEGRPT